MPAEQWRYMAACLKALASGHAAVAASSLGGGYAQENVNAAYSMTASWGRRRETHATSITRIIS